VRGQRRRAELAAGKEAARFTQGTLHFRISKNWEISQTLGNFPNLEFFSKFCEKPDSDKVCCCADVSVDRTRKTLKLIFSDT
jgi:hypothetical protein